MSRAKQILLFLLFSTVGISAQDVKLVIKSPALVDTLFVPASGIDSLLSDYLSKYKAQGYWETKINLSKSETDSRSLIANISPGIETTVSNIHFLDLPLKDNQHIQKEYLMGYPGISVLNLNKAEKRISNLGYHIAGEPAISKDSGGLYHLNYFIREKPELNAEALASFNRSAGADTIAWYGEINIYAPNLDGRGKSFLLAWKRLKSNSELLAMTYQHPWIFNNPLTAILSFKREVIDGTYQTVQSSVGMAWSIDWDKSLIFEFENYQSLITHEGRLSNPEWRSSKKKMLGLGIRQTGLDQAKHLGLSIKSSFQQELNFEPQSLSSFKLRSEAELSILPNLFLSQRSAWHIQNQYASATDPSIMNPLGGVSSVRGYQENTIRSPSTISLQHDINMQLGGESRMIVLLDIGVYNHKKSIHTMAGYGLGVQLASGQGPIRIIVASHKGLAFRNSFLHIEYARGLSWIDR